ncbi:MAG: hypothetical protein KC619_24035, partial [Myxococcales bacterium]|nr:hypothetical protein [Myxococcales bacterium]
ALLRAQVRERRELVGVIAGPSPVRVPPVPTTRTPARTARRREHRAAPTIDRSDGDATAEPPSRGPLGHADQHLEHRPNRAGEVRLETRRAS